MKLKRIKVGSNTGMARHANRKANSMLIGHETARTHLRGLFEKTQTRRQAELVSILLRTGWGH